MNNRFAIPHAASAPARSIALCQKSISSAFAVSTTRSPRQPSADPHRYPVIHSRPAQVGACLLLCAYTSATSAPSPSATTGRTRELGERTGPMSGAKVASGDLERSGSLSSSAGCSKAPFTRSLFLASLRIYLAELLDLFCLKIWLVMGLLSQNCAWNEGALGGASAARLYRDAEL
jgi:hypothetical protein